jgi:hypothetical protein
MTFCSSVPEMEQVLNLYKERGETPLARIKRFRRLHPEYANVPLSYAGRLDPMAEGLLVICVGSATRIAQFLTGLETLVRQYFFDGYASAGGDGFAAGSPASIAGIAWSGHAPVDSVEVGVLRLPAAGVEGLEWHRTELLSAHGPHVHSEWRLLWTPPDPGRYRLFSCARDAAGNVQPITPIHNRLGYGNNVVQSVEIDVS